MSKINKNMLWRLYDIKYEQERQDLPTEITVDLDNFPWSKDVEVGPMHLNFKAFRAIKEITGVTSTGCKVDMVRR